jgi:hypothetical protein
MSSFVLALERQPFETEVLILQSVRELVREHYAVL